MPAPKIELNEWGMGMRGKGRLAPPLKDKKMREVSGRHEPGIITGGGTGCFGVSSLWTHIHPTPDMYIHQYLFETPVDDSNTRLYLLNLRNFLTDSSDDGRMMGRNEAVCCRARSKRNAREQSPNSNPSFFAHDPRIDDWVGETPRKAGYSRRYR